MKSFGKLFSSLTLMLMLATPRSGLAQAVALPKEGQSPLVMTVDDLLETHRFAGTDLTNFMNVLAATPTLTPDELPRQGMLGNFFSLQHPDWPPLPADTSSSPVWPMADFYLLNDLHFSYDALTKKTGPRAKTSSIDPSDPGDGGGDTNSYDPGIPSPAVAYSTNDLWLQFVVQSNAVSSLVINTPWNVTGSNFMFDVFATTNWAVAGPGLNLTNWLLVTRSVPGQTNLLVSPMPGAVMCFYRLGTMQDTDGDGLTDAFEKLVSHTDPNVWDSNGNGISDGDEISPGGLPWRLMAVRPSSVVIFADIPTATQGGGCGEATVYLPSPAPAGGTTVQYYLGGTASLNSDYTVSPAANQLFIPAGNLSGSITVCASGTNTYSDLDLYTDITLTNATGYLVDGTPAHLSIVDTGPPGIRVFALPAWSRRPCDTYGTNVVGFYFIRDGDSTNTLTIGLSLAGSTAAVNSEFAAFPTNLTFPANVRTNWLPVTLVANSTNPADNSLTLTITNAPGYQVDPANGAATLTIAATAAPVLPVVQVTNNVPIATTAAAGQFTFTRSFTTATPLRVYFHAWNNTNTVIASTNGQDTTTYNALAGYVDIPANQASASVALNVTLQPATVQPVNVTLAAGDYAIGPNNTATVTVDAGGATGISIAETRVGSYTSGGTQPVEFTFTRTGSAAAPLSLAWRSSTNSFNGFNCSSTTMAGSQNSGQIQWAAGQSVLRTNFYFNFSYSASQLLPYEINLWQGVTFSNAFYNGSRQADFLPQWESVNLTSVNAPATVLTNGVTGNALVLTRPSSYGVSTPTQRYPLTVNLTLTGSAVYGTDYTMNTSVFLASNQTSVTVPVTALTATNQGWRTLVATVGSGSGQTAPAGLDTALVRLANPNNLVDDTDLDGDGLPDGFELNNLANGLNPIVPNNPYADSDRDGLGLMEELSLGLNPNVADSPPTYPSIENSDYVSLTLRVGALGKMLTEPVSSCAVCHAVTVRVGSDIASTSKTDWTHNPQITDYMVRLARGSNYPVQVTCNPFASSLLSSNQAAATTTPKYTAKYVAMLLTDTNGTPYPFIVDTNQLLGTNLSMVKEVLPKRATLYVPDLTIAADVDRSGIVDFQNRNDRTSATNPFVFWINDDCDTDSTNFDMAVDLNPSLYPIDSSSNGIVGVRDLEDFTRIQFKVDGLPGNLLTNAGYQIKLYVTNLVGTPSFRMFGAVETNGGLGYLTNLAIATTQITKSSLGIASNTLSLSLSNSLWQSAGVNSFFLPAIFEGVTTGSCIVTFGFSSNNAPPVVVSRPFYLNLQEATSLYEHWTVGDNYTNDWNTIPARAVRTADSAVYGNPKQNSDLDYILFVHGWRMQPWERRAFASTAFKRLWQLGYQGRFGLYSWPTDWVDDPLWQKIQDPRNYNRSERRAWDSARGLNDLISRLFPTSFVDQGRVRLIAHSMGNIVASEALRLRSQHSSLPLIQGYIASQAATVAHAYDASGPQTLTWLYHSPESYAAYPNGNTNRPYFTGIGKAVQKNKVGSPFIYNYHNGGDYALSIWVGNQELEKPDNGTYLGYNYYTNGWNYSSFDGVYSRFEWVSYFQIPVNAGNLNFKANTDEIFAYIAQARSRALGGAVTPGYTVVGEIGGAIDVSQPPFSFTTGALDHSAEFNSVNMHRRNYWRQVLATFGLTNNLTPP